MLLRRIVAAASAWTPSSMTLPMLPHLPAAPASENCRPLAAPRKRLKTSKQRALPAALFSTDPLHPGANKAPKSVLLEVFQSLVRGPVTQLQWDTAAEPDERGRFVCKLRIPAITCSLHGIILELPPLVTTLVTYSAVASQSCRMIR